MNEPIEVPAELEAKVISSLQQEGLIHRGSRGPWLQIAVLAAAVIIAFFFGRWSYPGSIEATHMILLDAGITMDQSEEAVRARVREYGEWAREGQANGTIVDGARLVDSGVEFEGDERILWPSGELISPSGWFLISAESEEVARRIAGSCPHLAHGGSISLRPLATGRETNPR